MKNKFLFSLLAVAVLLTMTGCEDDDKVASVPSYASVEVSDDIYTGQKGTAGVQISYAGAYVLHADNSYTLSKGGKIYGQGSWRVVDPRDNAPHFEFVAPSEPGIYSLNFSSRFSFYVDLPNGGIYGQSNSVSTQVNVMLADAVDACWGDSRERLAQVLSVKDTLANASACKVWKGRLAFYDMEASDLDSLGENSERIYMFDTDGGLCKVEERTSFELKYKQSYKEFEDGTSGEVNDSISSMDIYPHLMGVGNMNTLMGIGSSDYYEKVGDPVLEGEAKDIYPIKDWGKYEADEAKAKLINVFWSGALESYSQEWMLMREDGVTEVTKCTVRAYAKDDKFVIERIFEKK